VAASARIRQAAGDDRLKLKVVGMIFKLRHIAGFRNFRRRFNNDCKGYHKILVLGIFTKNCGKGVALWNNIQINNIDFH
jgi:hypothetical protein